MCVCATGGKCDMNAKIRLWKFKFLYVFLVTFLCTELMFSKIQIASNKDNGMYISCDKYRFSLILTML